MDLTHKGTTTILLLLLLFTGSDCVICCCLLSLDCWLFFDLDRWLIWAGWAFIRVVLLQTKRCATTINNDDSCRCFCLSFKVTSCIDVSESCDYVSISKSAWREENLGPTGHTVCFCFEFSFSLKQTIIIYSAPFIAFYAAVLNFF